MGTAFTSLDSPMMSADTRPCTPRLTNGMSTGLSRKFKPIKTILSRSKISTSGGPKLSLYPTAFLPAHPFGPLNKPVKRASRLDIYV